MGSVWRADHIDLGTPAAIKLIDETFAQSPEALTRFRREAQAAASLRSVHVVQILDYGVDGETPFIAMELLEGESLADHVERLGRIGPAECAAILLQVSKALSRAHEQGIVHRDLKPDNVFLVRDGDDVIAKVLDFGIAKRTGGLQTSSDMATRTGSLMGTPYYMSPEQASGRRQVDHRTDIWAFAVIAYECLTGRRPFDDSNLGGLLLSICTENPPPPSSRVAGVPSAFDAWFARCTFKDPVGRFDSIREAAAELCRAVGVVVPITHPVTASPPPGDASRLAVLPQPVTGVREAARGGPSVATPGAVAMSAASGVDSSTFARRVRGRPHPMLIVSGAIGILGLLSAVAAFALREGRHATTPTNAVTGLVTTAFAASVPVATSVAASNSPTASAPPASSTLQRLGELTNAAASGGAPGASVSTASAPTKARTATRTKPPRKPAQREAPVTRAGEPPATPRLRPLDRLERDLGF